MKPDLSQIALQSEPVAVGDGFAVTFSFAAGRLDAEWSPKVPSRKPHLAPAYRRARNEFLKHVAQQAGGGILVVEA